MGSPPAGSSSLIICTRERPRLLLETVESVLAGDEVPAELVIIDQSARPNRELEAMAALSGCRINYCLSQTVGLCRARNLGIAAAAYDRLVFLDDDMWVEKDWYGTLLGALEQAGPWVVVTGKVLPAADRADGFVPAIVTGDEPRTYTGRIGTDILAAGAMAMFRSTYQSLGPFDERLGAGSRFPAADDNDYGFRVLEAGLSIRYVPEAVVYHRAWRSRAEYPAVRRAYGRGKGGYFSKYLSLKDPYLLKRMLGDVLLRLARFPWRALHRPDLAVGDLYYVLGVFSGSLEWLSKERNTGRPELYPASFNGNQIAREAKHG